jgi:hypothetical protein
VIAAGPLASPTLCRYLTARRISIDIARKYCKKVDFELNDKKYTAIRFKKKDQGDLNLEIHFLKAVARRYV